MAEALELYPDVKFWVGPAVEGGFYYGVDFGGYVFSDKDFPTVEKKMLELAKQKSEYVRRDVPKSEAIAYFKHGQYKLDLLRIWRTARSPSTRRASSPTSARALPPPDDKAVKLLAVAGAYWRATSPRSS